MLSYLGQWQYSLGFPIRSGQFAHQSLRLPVAVSDDMYVSPHTGVRTLCARLEYVNL